MAPTTAATSWSKYAVQSVTPDSFAMTVDGRTDGPGPAHYATLRDALLASGDWLWIYAEASRRRGGKGHHYEWATIVFRSGKKYGFLTPKAYGERDGGGPRAWRTHEIPVLKNARDFVYMHSHPRGARAMGTAGRVFSGVEEDDDGTFYGDEATAIQNPSWWIGLLTPHGGIKRIKLTDRYRLQLPADTMFGRSMPLTKQIRKMYRWHRNEMFHRPTDRNEIGRDWKPGDRTWREQCIVEVAYEMRHTPVRAKQR